MSLNVPGVGSVPIRWLPASDEDFKSEAEGGRSGYQPIAIVHHRAVANTLHSIDVTFAAGDSDRSTVGSPGRYVSANFAIGDKNGRVEISQYVDLSDTAYCNGDCSQSLYGSAYPSRFDRWYGHKAHNERTVSIEHDDNGGSDDPDIKGLVTETIIKISIALDRLLLSGDLAAIRAAGIRCRDQATATALGKIVPGPQTLIDHNDIAGKAKPTCWRPWKADPGFPRTRYIAELTATAPEATDMPALTSYLGGQSATVAPGKNVRTAPTLSATVLRVTSASESWTTLLGWVKGELDDECGSDQWLVRWNGKYEYTSKCNLSAGPTAPGDSTPYSEAQVAAKVLEARRAQYDADKAAANADPVVLGPRP